MIFNFIAMLVLLMNQNELNKQVDDFFKKELKGFDSFNYEILNMPDDAISIKLKSVYFDKSKSLVSIPAELKLKDGRTIKKYLSCRLQLFRKALVADTLIERYSELKDKYFSFKQVEVNKTKGSPVFSFSEIFNKYARTRISPGNVLLEEFIEHVPVVKAGNKITANVLSGGTKVSISAVAKQDGSIDDVIRIVSQNKKIFKARIVDSLNVTIIE